MRIGLIQIDGKMPNLALMKISAYHKARGDEVIFPYTMPNIIDPADKVYVAVVFEKNRRIAQYYAYLGAEVGGTGWSLKKRLPPEIAAMKPDYDLYGLDYGMGYLSMGCVRRCPYCVVWRKEGYIHHTAWPEELINEKTRNLILLDGNFNNSPYWHQKAKWIIDNKYHVDFTQGYDIRSIDRYDAELIKAMSHIGQIHFAFDNIRMERAVRNGIETLLQVGFHPNLLTFYILTNYNSTLKEDLRRIEICEEYGVNPYVMIYDKYGAPKIIRHLQRWCCSIPPLRKVCRFEEYDRLDKEDLKLLCALKS